MPLNRTSAKSAPREDASPYKSHYNLRKAKASNDTPAIMVNNHARTSRAAAATNPGPPRVKVPRERCTNEQTAALEEFYSLHGGDPKKLEIEEFATRIDESYKSTALWIRNRRAKKGKATAGQQKALHATFDPVTDTMPLNDTIMLEDAAPEHPEPPLQTLAGPLPRSQKANKPRGRVTRLKNAKAAIQGPVRIKRELGTKHSFVPTHSSSPGINNVPINELLVLDDHQASGDSDGSVSQPPERTSATVTRTSVVVPWVLTEPEHALEEYPVDAQTAARMMTEMAVMTKNPGIMTGEILSDSPDLYKPWPFPFPSASNRRTTRSRSQKGDVGQWRQNGEERIYRVVPHMVPESWMAGSSRSGKARHP